MFYLKTGEGKVISQGHKTSSFTPPHSFTLTQKYSRFIKRAVSHCNRLTVLVFGNGSVVPSVTSTLSPPLNFTHHELLEFIIANTAQMAHHQPVSTTPMPGRAAKADAVSEESSVSAHFNGDEMNLGVPQIRRVKIITKYKIGPTEHCLQIFKEKFELYMRNWKCIHRVKLGSFKCLFSRIEDLSGQKKKKIR